MPPRTKSAPKFDSEDADEITPRRALPNPPTPDLRRAEANRKAIVDLASAVPPANDPVNAKAPDPLSKEVMDDAAPPVSVSTTLFSDAPSDKSRTSLKPESIWIRGDLYSPPDPLSNLPHIKFFVPEHETPAERRLREMRQSAHDWNHKFWSEHNGKFQKEKEGYTRQLNKKKVSADDMSVFYKDFLDRNRQLHSAYNKELYARNIKLLWPELVVSLQSIFRRIAR